MFFSLYSQRLKISQADLKFTMQKNSQPKLKAFRAIQKSFATIGISPELATQSYPLNRRILLGFLLIISGTISICVYIFNDAKTFFEYTQSICHASIGLLIFFALSILILKVEILFEFIDRCDNILNTGKLNFNFKSSRIVFPNLLNSHLVLKYTPKKRTCFEINRLEEKLSRIAIFVMVRMTPVCITVLWTTYIFFLYFTTDLGASVFELQCPMW